MNKRLLITIGLVVVMLGVAAVLARYLANQKTSPKQSEPKASKYYVNASPVNYSRIQAEVRATGRVISGNDVDLVSEVQGRILDGDVLLRKGTSFEKGDVLARIYKKDAEFNLKASKSSFLNLLASVLPDLKIDYPGAYDEWQAYFNSLNILQTFPPFPEIQDNQLKVFLSSRNLLSNYYSIKSQEEQLKKHTLTAPFDGTFTQVISEVGSVANPGTQIARMIRTDIMEVEVPVPASEARYLGKGDQVELYPGNENLKREGEIIRKANFIDQNTQSQSLFVQVDQNQNAVLFQGQYVEAVFKGRQLDDVMELPRNAVFDGHKVYTIEDNALREEKITIHKYNETTLLFSGVTPGVMIVTEPLINAKEGTEVEIL
ncbi:MAG: efflux RND transporter periplasmic adaptor subunit [Bacteroidota bacterium]